jgi:hemolysin III
MIRKLREPVNGLTHLAAAIAAAVGLALLLYLARQNATKLASLAVYGSTLILMFSASAAYHLIRADPRVVLFLRKLDHSAIFLLIAGTYTPICLHFFTGSWRLGLLAVIWSLAVIGIGVKLFVIHAPRWLTAGVYLTMGWLSVAAMHEILSSLPMGALAWLLLGGMFFTGGAVIYILKKPNLFPGVFSFHELWHIFVILGAFSHYIVMAVYVAPATWS